MGWRDVSQPAIHLSIHAPAERGRSSRPPRRRCGGAALRSRGTCALTPRPCAPPRGPGDARPRRVCPAPPALRRGGSALRFSSRLSLLPISVSAEPLRFPGQPGLGKVGQTLLALGLHPKSPRVRSPCPPPSPQLARTP